jgi:processive 1,2-diacylglycerol beta-glucosyltransferase
VILILTAGFGDGHNTAARSTAEAFHQLVPGESVEVCDLIAEALPRTARVLQRLYQLAIVNWPSAWRFVFGLLDYARVRPEPNKWQRRIGAALAAKIRASQPRLIVSTYPLYPGLVRWAGATGCQTPPVATIITDSISVHDLWVQPPSDLFCVADRETAEVVEKLGVPREKIHVTGFPVSPRFAEPLEDDAARAGRRRVLYLPSTSLPRVRETLDALRPLVDAGTEMTLVTGRRHSQLEPVAKPFVSAFPEGRVTTIGWTDRIPALLRTHDVVICKAGGAILHEVLAACCPAVIDYVVPGQEEGNAQYLVTHGCALRSSTAVETADHVQRLLADDGRLCRAFRAAMLPLSVPDSALRTARAALSLRAQK